MKGPQHVFDFCMSMENLSLLDCATGTGEVMFSIMKKRANDIKQIIGLDLAQEMMNKGSKVCEKLQYESQMSFVHASATNIPYEDNSFDCVSMAFGIRNVDDPQKCLHEIARVLKPNGITLIMECSLPPNRIIRWIYLIYFRHILPLIGGLISGDYKAYKYLNKTVETFPSGNNFIALMNNAGLESNFETLTFGITTLYIGKKTNDK